MTIADDDMVGRTIELAGCQLSATTWGDGPPSVILLHDGLGSISQWRDVPATLAAQTGLTVLAYDRAGHGRSTPIPTGPWPADWLHTEAELLAALIDATGAPNPALIGHSDGGSIAAIHAAQSGMTAPMVLLAAHSWVESKTADEIRHMRTRRNDFERGLSRHHEHPAALFEAWSGVWVSEEFGRWDIRPTLSTVGAPTLVVQGANDEYAAAAHAAATATAIGDNAESVLLNGLGHLLHHQDPARVVDVIADHLAAHRG